MDLQFVLINRKRKKKRHDKIVGKFNYFFFAKLYGKVQRH